MPRKRFNSSILDGLLILEKYNGFDWELPQDKLVTANVLSKLDDDCNMKTNVISERYKFLTRRQLHGESCDNFVTQLRSLCASCEFVCKKTVASATPT